MEKYYVFILVGFLLCFQLNAQSHKHQDSVRYVAAYNWIISDSLDMSKNIYVHDTIVDLDRWPFIEEINDGFKENKTLADYWKFEWKENEYSPLIASTFSRETNGAEFILIFSPIENEMISASLVRRKKDGKGKLNMDFRISWIMRYTEAYIYLFIFDKDDNIDKVFKRLMIYD